MQFSECVLGFSLEMSQILGRFIKIGVDERHGGDRF